MINKVKVMALVVEYGEICVEIAGLEMAGHMEDGKKARQKRRELIDKIHAELKEK